jgi:hypothetical protein
MGMQLTELPLLRDGADVLALDAICRAADGDYRGAFENIDAMFRIAEHVRSEPFNVSFWEAAYIDRRAIEALQRVLASSGISTADIAPLQILDGPSYRVLIKRESLMEEAMMLDTFKQVCDGKGNQVIYYDLPYDSWPCLVPWRFAPVYRVFLFDADLAAFRRRAADLEGIASGATYREIRDKAIAFDQHFDFDVEPGGVLTAACMPLTSAFVRGAATADARRRLACVGLAMRRYRAKNGHFAKKLDDLPPEFLAVVPPDPFDDKPLKLKRTKNSLILYSIGPDMTDDSGAPFDETNKTGDIVFELPTEKR